jgi:hypothetical protein
LQQLEVRAVIAKLKLLLLDFFDGSGKSSIIVIVCGLAATPRARCLTMPSAGKWLHSLLPAEHSRCCLSSILQARGWLSGRRERTSPPSSQPCQHAAYHALDEKSRCSAPPVGLCGSLPLYGA